MGNNNSNYRDSDTDSNCSDFLDKPEWTSEMCTPRLSVSMTADSRHVLIKYRTDGNEILEIKARGTEPNMTREIMEFGKALHHFSNWDSTKKLDVSIPTCTLFMNDSEGMNHHCGYVEISVERQVLTDEEKIQKSNKCNKNSLEIPTITLNDEINEEKAFNKFRGSNGNITKRPSAQLGDIFEESPSEIENSDDENTEKVLCEEVIPKKYVHAQRCSIDVDMARLNDYSSTFFVDQFSLNETDESFITQPSKLFDTLRKSGKSRSLSLNDSNMQLFRNNVSLDSRRASEPAKVKNDSPKIMNPNLKPSKNMKLGNGDIESNGKLESIDGKTDTKISRSSETPWRAATDSGSDTDSTVTQSPERELNDGEVVLRQCIAKLRPTPTKQRKVIMAEIDSAKSIVTPKCLNMTDGRHEKGQETPLSASKSKQVFKNNEQNPLKDPRTEAWLAFVRTLRHHDQDTLSETSLSDFSDFDIEQGLSLSSTSNGED